jgi:hypothetical protein
LAFFAVLRPERADRADWYDPDSCELHVNLWCLGGLLGRTFLLDVGLLVRAGEKPLSTMSLGVPFDTERLEDLADKILSRQGAELIFDAPWKSTTEDGLTFRNGKSITVRRLDSANCTQDEQRRASGFSLWKLVLDKPVEAKQAAYIRVRMRVIGLGRAWQWQRTLFAKNGAIVDLRVADVRGTLQLPSGEILSERVLPIDKVGIFVIAPSRFRLHTQNPQPHYVRVLEGGAWKDYLERVPEFLGGRSKLIVYYQRGEGSAADGRISVEKPFRAFLGLTRDPPVQPLTSALRITIVLSLTALLLTRVPARPDVTYVVTAVGRILRKMYIAIVGTGFAGLIVFLLAKRYVPIKATLQGASVALRRLEAWLYRHLK